MSGVFVFLVSAAFGIIAHAVLARVTGKSISSIAAAGAISIACLWIMLLRADSPFAEILGWSLALVFGCELYVFLITLTQGSISANILVLLSRRPLQSADIDALYDSRKMVFDRIERLAQSGLIVSGDGGWRITPLGLATLRKLSVLDWIFGHRRTG